MAWQARTRRKGRQLRVHFLSTSRLKVSRLASIQCNTTMRPRHSATIGLPAFTGTYSTLCGFSDDEPDDEPEPERSTHADSDSEDGSCRDGRRDGDKRDGVTLPDIAAVGKRIKLSMGSPAKWYGGKVFNDDSK